VFREWSEPTVNHTGKPGKVIRLPGYQAYPGFFIFRLELVVFNSHIKKKYQLAKKWYLIAHQTYWEILWAGF
jgi:hypothetical protein